MRGFLNTAVLVVIFMLLWFPASVHAFEIQSRYATITYASQNALREFNKSLYLSGNLKSQAQKQGVENIEDDVKAKINVIVEKAMSVMDMFPPNLKFSIVIHPDTTGVKTDFKRLYNVDVNYIAFYSPGQNTIFFSANKATIRVVAHEIGHVIAENYFAISPPPRIHEVLAQYAEKHITD